MKQNYAMPSAIAAISGSVDYPNLSGQVLFYQQRHCVLVEVNLHGLPNNKTGFFGFHIHTGDICAGKVFSGSGSHYNPTNTTHPHHAGDLPPLLSCHGGAYMTVMSGRFRVDDIIGRTVVVHDMADDFHTQPAGNAGIKIACGVIHKA